MAYRSLPALKDIWEQDIELKPWLRDFVRCRYDEARSDYDRFTALAVLAQRRMPDPKSPAMARGGLSPDDLIALKKCGPGVRLRDWLQSASADLVNNIFLFRAVRKVGILEGTVDSLGYLAIGAENQTTRDKLPRELLSFLHDYDDLICVLSVLKGVAARKDQAPCMLAEAERMLGFHMAGVSGIELPFDQRMLDVNLLDHEFIHGRLWSSQCPEYQAKLAEKSRTKPRNASTS